MQPPDKFGLCLGSAIPLLLYFYFDLCMCVAELDVLDGWEDIQTIDCCRVSPACSHPLILALPMGGERCTNATQANQRPAPPVPGRRSAD